MEEEVKECGRCSGGKQPQTRERDPHSEPAPVNQRQPQCPKEGCFKRQRGLTAGDKPRDGNHNREFVTVTPHYRAVTPLIHCRLYTPGPCLPPYAPPPASTLASDQCTSASPRTPLTPAHCSPRSRYIPRSPPATFPHRPHAHRPPLQSPLVVWKLPALDDQDRTGSPPRALSAASYQFAPSPLPHARLPRNIPHRLCMSSLSHTHAHASYV